MLIMNAKWGLQISTDQLDIEPICTSYVSDTQQQNIFAILAKSWTLASDGKVNSRSQKIHAGKQCLAFHETMFHFSSELWNPIKAQFS